MYRLGSKVSVEAMPPPIQSTMTVSAVAGGRRSPAPSAASVWRGNPAPKAPRVAALSPFTKSRRVKSGVFMVGESLVRIDRLFPFRSQWVNWNSGSRATLQSRSSTPSAFGFWPTNSRVMANSWRVGGRQRP